MNIILYWYEIHTAFFCCVVNWQHPYHKHNFSMYHCWCLQYSAARTMWGWTFSLGLAIQDNYLTADLYCLEIIFRFLTESAHYQTWCMYLPVQYWCLSLLVEIQHLDSHTLWHVMSVLPVLSLVPPLCSGWDLAALVLSLLVETSLWGLHHPTLSSSTHCGSPMLDSTPARLLLEVTLGQLQLWWIFQVCNWPHCTSLSLIGYFRHSIPAS